MTYQLALCIYSTYGFGLNTTSNPTRLHAVHRDNFTSVSYLLFSKSLMLSTKRLRFDYQVTYSTFCHYFSLILPNPRRQQPAVATTPIPSSLRNSTKFNIYTFQRDTQCCSTDCLLMHGCQLYMFRTYASINNQCCNIVYLVGMYIYCKK